MFNVKFGATRSDCGVEREGFCQFIHRAPLMGAVGVSDRYNCATPSWSADREGERAAVLQDCRGRVRCAHTTGRWGQCTNKHDRIFALLLEFHLAYCTRKDLLR